MLNPNGASVRTLWALSLTLAPTLLACGADPLCTAEPIVCDVQSSECQQRIFASTACQRRQEPGPMPEIRTITPEDFRDELTQELGPSPAPTPWDVGLGLMGLISNESSGNDSSVDALVTGVLAFYDPTTKDVTILSQTEELDLEGQAWVLSHEFVHVLQDRAVGLQTFGDSTSTDGSVASDMLVEGEAMLHSTVLQRHSDGEDPGDLEFDAYFSRIATNVWSSIDDSASPLIDAVLNLPYPLGGSLVSDAWLAGGQAAIGDLYGRWRISSMAAWKRGYPDALSTDLEPLRCAAPPAPPGYELYGEDVFGPVGVASLWAARGKSSEDGWDLADHWQGGHVRVFGKGGSATKPPKGTLFLWQTRWDDADNARSWVRGAPEARSHREGRSAWLFESDDDDALDWLEEHADEVFTCAEPKQLLRKGLAPSEGPKPWDRPRRRRPTSLAQGLLR